MALKRNSSSPEWIEFEAIGGKLLLTGKTPKLTAKYEKRLGMTPHGIRNERGDGDEIVASVLQVSLDPVRVYEAQVWLLDQIVHGVEAEWDDGTPIDGSAKDELHEAIIGTEGLFAEVVAAAEEIAGRRRKVAEKN